MIVDKLLKIGESLFSVGGTMLVAGLVMARFPQAISWFGKLPGDFMNERVIAPVVSLIIVSVSLSLVSALFGLLIRVVR